MLWGIIMSKGALLIDRSPAVTSATDLDVRFLEELKTQNRYFEINSTLLGHSYIKLDFIIYFGQSSATITPSDDV